MSLAADPPAWLVDLPSATALRLGAFDIRVTVVLALAACTAGLTR